MTGLEKRDRLAPAAEANEWGECFIAARDGDMVHTLSGIADSFELEHDMEHCWSSHHISMEPTGGITVTIHFSGTVVEERRPFDGKVVE